MLIRLKGRNVQANERDKINASHGKFIFMLKKINKSSLKIIN